jgi:hypothetical protein
MVIIDNFFIHYKRPEQYIFAGENYLDIYKFLNKSFQKTRTIENISIFGPGSDHFESVTQELGAVDTGIILNSAYYIFNIFDFEKVPLRDDRRQEIVEWRLRKVFPEKIEEYNHQFFKLSKNKVLSILFKKNLKEKIEELFTVNDINLIYMGNSTVNIMNNVVTQKTSPDFFIEINRDLFIIVFQNCSVPFYIRKFRNENENEVKGEIVKTINYVKNSYSQVPRTYSIISNRSDLDFDSIGDELSKLDIHLQHLKNRENLFLPLPG